MTQETSSPNLTLQTEEDTHSCSGGFLPETLSVLPDTCPLLEKAPVVQGVCVRRQGSAEDQTG